MKQPRDLAELQNELRKLSGKGARKNASTRVPDTSLKRVERRKKRKNSKVKGSSYERKIAKKFSKWTGELVYRTPMSGGWAVAQGTSGDLNCDSPAWKWHVECKKREDWVLEDLITGLRKRDTRSIIEWWQQTVRTCPKGRRPMLVFARSRQPDLLMLFRDHFFFAIRRTPAAEFLPHYRFVFDGLPRGNGEIIILALDDFLAAVRPSKGCKNFKKWKLQPGALAKAARLEDNEETT